MNLKTKHSRAKSYRYAYKEAVDCATALEALVLLLVAQFTAGNNMLSVVQKIIMANCLVIFNFSCLSRIRINCNYNGAGSPHTPGRDPTGGSAPGGTRCPSKTRPTGQAPSTGPRGEKSSNTLLYYYGK